MAFHRLRKTISEFLLKKCEVHAIIDSEYKYFETADINTIITIIRNRNENKDNLPVKFFHCDGSLENIHAIRSPSMIRKNYSKIILIKRSIIA